MVPLPRSRNKMSSCLERFSNDCGFRVGYKCLRIVEGLLERIESSTSC
jgi:hypothetical protein